MRRLPPHVAVALVALSLLAAATTVAAQGTPVDARTVAAHGTPVDAQAVALQLLDRLDARQFDAAAQPFDPGMRAAVPVDRLASLWTSLPPSRGRGEPRSRAVDGATLVAVPLHREGVELVAQVAVGPDGAIRGFLVQPAPPAAAPPAPADAPYLERELLVGSGATALPATLAMPRGVGPFPAVVLVHGSGPQDRDETIGANRPFLDLARGLASRGIAVLRYEKRTRAHPSAFVGRDFGVDEETTDDAVAALALLRAQPGIEITRVYVLGHSQGGMLAPRIAARSGHAAGMILLAAPARRLLDLLPEQNRYMAALDGTISGAERAAIAGIEAAIANIRGGAARSAAELPLGLPMAYWRSIDAIDAVADARASTLPILFLQGGRDFQVTSTDWQAWQAAFAGDARATFRHYPALDHLAIAGVGPSSLQDYGRPGTVDARLIDDIASWIATPR